MKTYFAPDAIPQEGRFLFFGGSIEMGAAVEWQSTVTEALSGTEWTLLNPRREEWDGSWAQRKDFAPFREQVLWELDGLERAERILLYYDPQTKSPISLLELGLFARSDKLLVVCPEGFWRKGNVDLICERFGIRQMPSLEAAVALLREC